MGTDSAGPAGAFAPFEAGAEWVIRSSEGLFLSATNQADSGPELHSVEVRRRTHDDVPVMEVRALATRSHIQLEVTVSNFSSFMSLSGTLVWTEKYSIAQGRVDQWSVVLGDTLRATPVVSLCAHRETCPGTG